jgi:parvulin-like peptidyl-prolyl isomerase
MLLPLIFNSSGARCWLDVPGGLARRFLLSACLGLLVTVSGRVTAADGGENGSRSKIKLSDLFGDEVLARGKGVVVKRSQLEEAFTAYSATLAARGQSIPEEKRLAQEAQLLQRLIVTQILTNRVTEADVKAATEMAEKKLKEARDRAVSQETFHRQLKAVGLSYDTYRRVVMEESFAQTVVQREVASTIKVTDAQVKQLYEQGVDVLVRLMQDDLANGAREPATPPARLARMKEQVDAVRKANLARLEQPERVKVSHVFLATSDRKTEEPLSEEQKKFKRLQLERIRKRALDGEDFAKLVQEYSEDRGVKETKGEYTFGREDPFAPEFKAAAFSLEAGKISDVVTTKIGLHVIKLLEKVPTRKTEFAKVSDELKEFLTQQEVQRLMPEYFARVAKEAAIEVLDPKYRINFAADAAARK